MLWCFIKLPQFSTRIFDRNSVFFKTVPLFFCCVVQSDLEDQSNELRNAEDQAKKAIVDAARLADELRQEQDHASQIEKMRRTLENQVSVFRLSSLPCDFLFFFYCESCIVGQYPRWRFSAGVYVIRLFICFSTRYIKTRRSLLTRHRNIPLLFLETRLYWDRKVKGQDHEPQKHCRRGSFHVWECWLFLDLSVIISMTTLVRPMVVNVYWPSKHFLKNFLFT